MNPWPAMRSWIRRQELNGLPPQRVAAPRRPWALIAPAAAAVTAFAVAAVPLGDGAGIPATTKPWTEMREATDYPAFESATIDRSRASTLRRGRPLHSVTKISGRPAAELRLIRATARGAAVIEPRGTAPSPDAPSATGIRGPPGTVPVA